MEVRIPMTISKAQNALNDQTATIIFLTCNTHFVMIEMVDVLDSQTPPRV